MRPTRPIILLLSSLLWSLRNVTGRLEAYTGVEPTDAVSNRFSVLLQDESSTVTAVKPHVYMSASPDAELQKIHKDANGHGIFCRLHGAQFCNRTVSWVEFGSSAQAGSVLATVTSLDGPVFAARPVYASPLRCGVHVDVMAGGHSVQLRLPSGNNIRFSLEYGDAPGGSFRHSLLFFAGPLDPTFPTQPARENLLRFPPGVTRVPGDGILQLPRGVDTVFLPRGSWLDGRINVTRHTTGPVRVVGHGIISGRRFIYKGGKQCDYLRSIEVQYDRPLQLSGPTLVDPKGHALFVPPHSIVHNLKVLGWLYNEDGVWLSTNSTLSQSFIRTNDDSIRLYAGELDAYSNQPAPVRGKPAWGVVVKQTVVSQLFNGGVIQIGWEDAGIVDSIVTGLDVVRAEWYHTNGDPSGANNAVLSLRGPVYDISMAEHHRNITVEDVRIDGTVGRILGLGLFGAPAARSTANGIILRQVWSRHPLSWWQTGTTIAASGGAIMNSKQEAASVPGDNFLIAEAPSSICGVLLEKIVIAGQHIARHSDWNLNVSGSVTGVVYK